MIFDVINVLFHINDGTYLKPTDVVNSRNLESESSPKSLAFKSSQSPGIQPLQHRKDRMQVSIFAKYLYRGLLPVVVEPV